MPNTFTITTITFNIRTVALLEQKEMETVWFATQIHKYFDLTNEIVCLESRLMCDYQTTVFYVVNFM